MKLLRVEPEGAPLPLWLRKPAVTDWLTPAEVAQLDELAAMYLASRLFLRGLALWCAETCGPGAHSWGWTEHLGDDVEHYLPLLTTRRSSRVPAELRRRVLAEVETRAVAKALGHA